MKNKKAAVGPGIIVFAIIGLLLLGIIGYGIFTLANKPVNVNIQGGDDNTPIGGNCETYTALAVTATDALNLGTAIGGLTVSYAKNGVYVGTTSPTVTGGDDISFIAGNATTIDEIFPAVEIKCGPNPKEITLKTYGNGTIRIAPDTLSGTGQYLTNAAAGGAANETKTAAGDSRNWEITFKGNDKKTTGKQLVIVELSSPSNVSSLSMSGATEVPVPNGYTRQLTNGYVEAFEIPAVEGNSVATYNLAVTASTSTIIQGAVYTSWYAEQAFVDTDGSFKVGAFDALNTAKWQDRQNYNFMMA